MTETLAQHPLTRARHAMAENYLLPGGLSGDVEVKAMEVSEEDSSSTRLRAMLKGRGYVPAGTYTALYRRGGLWMSNTPDEIRDHWELLRNVSTVEREDRGRGARRVLVGGLGIGALLPALLELGVTHIDVVEIDPDVIAIVSPAVQALAERHGATIVIHEADVFEIKWPAGTRWDCAWFDVWQNLSGDNLPEMAKLARSYGRRVAWQGFWGKDEIKAHQRRYGW